MHIIFKGQEHKYEAHFLLAPPEEALCLLTLYTLHCALGGACWNCWNPRVLPAVTCCPLHALAVPRSPREARGRAWHPPP